MPAESNVLRQKFADFIERLTKTGVAQRADLVGCSEDEICGIETKYGVRLPAAYRMYLSEMGRSSGRLFTHDHVEANYPGILRFTEEYRRRDSLAGQRRVVLSGDALIISNRLGEQHLFLRCGGQPDPPVHYFADWDEEACESHPSVLEPVMQFRCRFWS